MPLVGRTFYEIAKCSEIFDIARKNALSVMNAFIKILNKFFKQIIVEGLDFDVFLGIPCQYLFTNLRDGIISVPTDCLRREEESEAEQKSVIVNVGKTVKKKSPKRHRNQHRL